MSNFLPVFGHNYTTPGPFGISLPGRTPSNLGLLASEPLGTFGLNDQSSLASGCGFFPGGGGFGQPTMEVKLAKSPQEKQEAADRAIALSGSDKIKHTPCGMADDHEKAQKYRDEHNALQMAKAQQFAAAGGRVVFS